MGQPAVVSSPAKSARHGMVNVDTESLSAAELRDLYEQIYGEPSDDEIAAALRRAKAEYEAGDYAPPSDDDDDDEPYRQPTKQEILDGIAEGYKQGLAGDVISHEEFLGLLED